MAVRKNKKSGILITGTAAADSIVNGTATYDYDKKTYTELVRADSVTIGTGAGNDTIWNYNGMNVSINGGTGNDKIFNTSTEEPSKYDGSNSTLIGGDGYDDISNGSNNVLIDAGDGYDTIVSRFEPWGLTIEGGKGNDLIRNESDYFGEKNLIKYKEGDGNDIIEGFGKNNTLQIGDGTGTYSTQVSGSDLIVTVGKGSIRLKNYIKFFPNILGKNMNPPPKSKFIQGTTKGDKRRQRQ